MSKREKKPNRQKSPLEMVPTRKLIAMVKKDIKQTIKTVSAAAKPKKK
jgi:hypothetical protein